MPEQGSSLTVLFRHPEESWNSFARRVREMSGEMIVVLSSADNTFLTHDDERAHFLEDCAKVRYRLRLATKEPGVLRPARKRGLRVYNRTRQLRDVLKDHPLQDEALRVFSPSLWRQHWRSRLQRVGLLSVPKVRIWILVGTSGLLFLFVFFRLLPSAEVKVWARSEVISHTMNVLLAETGAVLPPGYARVMPLETLKIIVRKSITFDDISTEFTGTDATVPMTFVNTTDEQYSFRKGTRVTNQAGMVFKTQREVLIPAKGEATVMAKAEHLDLYDKVIGERGNVPANLQWEVPGLDPAERKLVFAKNLKPGTGGTTSQRTVLRQEDLELGKKRLMQELLVTAKQLVEEERQMRNAEDPTKQLELLDKEQVIVATYSGFILPTQFIGQPVLSIPIEGQLIYAVPSYNVALLEEKYSKELVSRTGEGKRLVADTVHADPSRVIIIEYDDNHTWIKITADVVGTEHFELDPLTPMGARFGKKVREAIAGLSVKDAQRILKNFPEVDRVDIGVWPPWSGTVPPLLSSIRIVPQ